MTHQESNQYRELLGELKAIEHRLKSLADAGYSDIEGADAIGHVICEAIFSDCDDAATNLRNAITIIEDCLDGKLRPGG